MAAGVRRLEESLVDRQRDNCDFRGRDTGPLREPARSEVTDGQQPIAASYPIARPRWERRPDFHADREQADSSLYESLDQQSKRNEVDMQQEHGVWAFSQRFQN